MKRLLAGTLALLTCSMNLSAQDAVRDRIRQELLTGETPEARRMRERLEIAQDFINVEQWQEAALIYQSVLNRRPDILVRVRIPGPDGKPTIAMVSAWSEAERHLARFPEKALRAYQQKQEPVAAEMLRSAKDNVALAEIDRRFHFTPSGLLAAERLLTANQEAGKHVEALPIVERLLMWPGAAKLSNGTLYRCVLGQARTGRRSSAEKHWKLLEPRIGSEGLMLGKRKWTAEELRKECEKIED